MSARLSVCLRLCSQVSLFVCLSLSLNCEANLMQFAVYASYCKTMRTNLERTGQNRYIELQPYKFVFKILQPIFHFILILLFIIIMQCMA